MSKKIKEMELNHLRQTFRGVKDMVLLEPLKLDSATDFELRKRLRSQKIRVKMVKNTLAKKVFDENGVKVDLGKGPTLLCWGADSLKELGTAIEAVLNDLKKDPKAPERLREKTAVAEGQPVPLSVAKTLPTRKEAIGELVAAIIGPAQAVAAALLGPANNLAGILKAIEEKEKTSPAPAAG
jgi:large subunit ribosomal protein L10